MHADPIRQFKRWYREAASSGETEPDAVTLATVGSGGRPSARVVYLRGIDARGFAFFTNYRSRKGRELGPGAAAAFVFFWPRRMRQVRIEGRVRKLALRESDAYFRGRPRGNQLAAWASPQSERIADRAALDAAWAAAAARFRGRPVPRPPHWGGYRLAPDRLEFWQRGEHRLHDRLRYRRLGRRWILERLAP